MDYTELIKDIAPYVKLWTLNQGLIYGFIADIKTNKIKVRDDAIIGTYGAGEGRGSEFRKPLSESRYLGWDAWKSGVGNCMPNPYFKGWLYYCDYGTRGETGGIGGERWVSYIRQDNPTVPLADCPFWEGIREGMEEGNLAAILTWYLEKLQKAGKPQPELTRRLGILVGDSPAATIKRAKSILKRYGMDIDVYRINASRQDYKKGKKELLEMLKQVARMAEMELKPSLSWHDLPLLKDGRIMATIYEGQVSAVGLRKKMRELSGYDFPVVSNGAFKTAGMVHIIIGNAKQNRFAAELLREFKTEDASETYPGRGSYFIREFRKDSQWFLWIAGPDVAGTTKGAEMFAMFLQAYGHWLR